MPSVWWLVAGAVVALYVRISRISASVPCEFAWLIELLGRIVRLTDPPSVLPRLCDNSLKQITVFVTHNALSTSTTSRTPSRPVRSSPIAPPLGALHY